MGVPDTYSHFINHQYFLPFLFFSSSPLCLILVIFAFSSLWGRFFCDTFSFHLCCGLPQLWGCVGLTVLALQSSHLDLFPRLISSVFHRYSLCPLISIHHLHPSCLISMLLLTKNNGMDAETTDPQVREALVTRCLKQTPGF